MAKDINVQLMSGALLPAGRARQFGRGRSAAGGAVARKRERRRRALSHCSPLRLAPPLRCCSPTRGCPTGPLNPIELQLTVSKMGPGPARRDQIERTRGRRREAEGAPSLSLSATSSSSSEWTGAVSVVVMCVQKGGSFSVQICFLRERGLGGDWAFLFERGRRVFRTSAAAVARRVTRTPQGIRRSNGVLLETIGRDLEAGRWPCSSCVRILLRSV